MVHQSLYQARLLELYKSSPYRGVIPQPTATSGIVNPSCGDSITISLILENNSIREIKFQGVGCVISQAAASLTLEALEGLSVDKVQNFRPEDVLKLLGIPLGPTRLRCGILALEAVHQALKSCA